MHFRPILLLHCPRPRPLPLCTSEWHQECTPCQSSADLHQSCGGRVIRPSAQGGLDLEKVLPFLFMVIKFGSTCLQSERMCWYRVEHFILCSYFICFRCWRVHIQSGAREKCWSTNLIERMAQVWHVFSVYHTAIKWLSEPQCVRVSASATSWKWRSIGSSSDF